MLVVAELNSPILPRLSMVARFLVARNVMFSGKQTTAHKMADQLKNCINQRSRGFYSNCIHTAGSVWITDTITNVMIRYNKNNIKCNNYSGLPLDAAPERYQGRPYRLGLCNSLTHQARWKRKRCHSKSDFRLWQATYFSTKNLINKLAMNNKRLLIAAEFHFAHPVEKDS